MLVTLDIKNESMKESFLNFVKTLDNIDIKEEIPSKQQQNKNEKDKFAQFAGMWENRDISIQTIRDEAWQR